MQNQNQNNLTPIEGYTVDHDVLTDKGWIPISEVKKESKVATLINRTRLEYHNPSDVKEYDCDEEIYDVDTTQINVSVTKNHNMLMGNRGGNYSINAAQKCYHKRWTFMKNCEEWMPDFSKVCPKELELNNEKTEATHFLIYDDKGSISHKFDINSWLIFFGVFLAEGCTSRDWNNMRINVAAHKQRVKDALLQCFKVMDINVYQYKDKKNDAELNSWRVKDKFVVNYFIQFSVGAINKYMPEWVWYLTPSQAKILLEGMELGDGHIMENGTIRYDTSSIQLADDYQRLCLHAGFSANKYLKYEAGHSAYCESKDETITSTVDAWRLTRVQGHNTPIMNKNYVVKTGKGANDRYIKYTGKIYSCTMPNNEPIYIRKNGKPVWC